MNRCAARILKGRNALALMVSAALAAVLAACIATIALPAPLSVAGSGDAYNPAVALAADGTKHVVWQECPASGGCVIEYYRTKLGEPQVTLSLAPPAGASNVNPDIALSADGMAYIVWTEFYSSTPTASADAYAVLSANGNLASTAHLDPGAGQPLHTSVYRPRVVARGNNVFALYSLAPTLLADGGSFYRQLKPLDALNGAVAISGIAISSSFIVAQPTLAIDHNGKLHSAYQYTECFFLSCSDSVRQADNTAGANMSSVPLETYARTASDPDPLSAPDIAVADNNSIFITYAYSSTTDAVIYARGTTAATGFVTATVPLTGSLEPWHVAGSARVAAVNNQPVVAFAASNNTTPFAHEIWLYPDGAANVTRITHGSGDQNEPLIAAMGAPVGGEAAVVGWRTWLHFVGPHPPCLRNGYEWDQNNEVVQPVFAGTGGCFSTGQAIAANENWTTAVWIDDKPPTPRLVPWLGFNANTTMLPMIRR